MTLQGIINKYYKGEDFVNFTMCYYTGISALLSNARINYPNPQHLHLYTAFLGKAGSKKSIVSDVKKCFQFIQEDKIKTWMENEKRGGLPPLFFLPANSSSSALIECISRNEGQGIIWESEIETLSSILSTEYGNFSDVLRNNFHEESISFCRRSEKEYIQCLTPHIACLLAGTYLQAKCLFSGGENGLFSRFIFFNLKENAEWENFFCERDERRDLYEYTRNFLRELLLRETNIGIISFTEEQKKRHYKYFSEALKNVKRDFMLASIKRKGLIFLRLASIIEVVKRIENEDDLGDFYCSDESWNEAIYLLSFTNAEEAYDRMNMESENEVERKRNNVYYALPKHFTLEDIGDNISTATKYRYIAKWVRCELIEKRGKGWEKV